MCIVTLRSLTDTKNLNSDNLEKILMFPRLRKIVRCGHLQYMLLQSHMVGALIAARV